MQSRKHAIQKTVNLIRHDIDFPQLLHCFVTSLNGWFSTFILFQTGLVNWISAHTDITRRFVQKSFNHNSQEETHQFQVSNMLVAILLSPKVVVVRSTTYTHISSGYLGARVKTMSWRCDFPEECLWNSQ